MNTPASPSAPSDKRERLNYLLLGGQNLYFVGNT